MSAGAEALHTYYAVLYCCIVHRVVHVHTKTVHHRSSNKTNNTDSSSRKGQDKRQHDKVAEMTTIFEGCVNFCVCVNTRL